MASSIFGTGGNIEVNVNGTLVPQSFVGSGGQTVFTLTDFIYVPGTNSLLVWINGQKQELSRGDFFETSPTTFTLGEGVIAGDFVDVIGFPEINLTGFELGATQFIQTGVGALPRTVLSKLQDLINAKDFGVIGDGVINDTAALLSFYEECINTGRPGYIPAGTYLITEGVLIFNTPFVDAIWPDIFTAGHQAVIFVQAGITNAPMLRWTNGTATSGAGRYWRGGSHGGITIRPGSAPATPGRHGIALRGIWGTTFGWIRCENIGGSAVWIEPLLYAGNNPDPYAVTFCNFAGIEANRCKLYGLQNENYVGFNFCTLQVLRVIECEGGGWFGIGSGNTLNFASMGTVKGWAIDDGNNAAATGGASSKTYINLCELDDVQNGFRINRASNLKVNVARFVHRYNFNPAFNPGEGYWPRKCLQVAAGVASSVINICMEFLHRVETGGLKVNMGSFSDFSGSAAILNFKLDHRVIDNAGFGFTDTDLFTGLNVNGTVNLTRDGTRIADTFIKPYGRAGATAATVVLNSNYTITKVQFPTEDSDRNNLYNGTDTFTVPFSGPYRIQVKLCLAMAAGTRVRLSVVKNASIVSNVNDFAVTASAQHYTLSDTVNCIQGDILWVTADQNTATASIAVSTPINASIDNHFIIEAI